MRSRNTAIGNLLAITIALAVVAAPSMADAPTADAASSEGVWQQHEYQLTFTGFQSAYSCDWLEEKLRLLLRKSGARNDIHISTHCVNPSGPSPGAEARITFFTLAPGDGPLAVPAVWRKVVLRDHYPLALEGSDCELVEQFRAELLPFFTTRAIVNHMRCRGGDDAAAGLDLQFEVLAPASGGGR
jgi:hypothetical protein